MNYMFLPYKRFVDFSGRSRPLEYWLFALLYLAEFIVALFIDVYIFGVDYDSYYYYGNGGVSAGVNMNAGPGAIVVVLVNFLPSLAVTIRRAHDSDRSGWWILVPFYNLILMCFPGTRGPNRFGPDPYDDGKAGVFS